jgi:hypothetical protein
VVCQEAIHKGLWVVRLPPPSRGHGILMVPPAEYTLVGARQRWGGLHALVRRDPVERVLVAPAPAPQHRFRPPAELDAAVRPHKLIPLLGKTVILHEGKRFVSGIVKTGTVISLHSCLARLRNGHDPEPTSRSQRQPTSNGESNMQGDA